MASIQLATKAAAPPSGLDPVVLIISSAYNSLPAPGNRVGPSDASNMPTIQANTGYPAFVTADGAHHFRLVGLNIKAPSTLLQTAVVQIGGGETTLAEFPTDVTIDRCIVRGDATNGVRRGVQLDGIRCAAVDSYVYDCKENGSDSQAVWAYNTPGPLKIVNNYLEGAGENMMFGGADPHYANSVPSDIEIRRNYFKKQSAASWAASWQVKNLLEFKNAQRVLVEGNVLDTNYLDAQSGYAILITPRNQDGTAPWCVTQDITLRLNNLKNAEGGINISGDDSDQTSQRTYRVTLQDNLFEIKDLSQGGVLRCHGIIRGPVDVQIINNTFVFANGTTGSSCGFHENTPKADRTIWRSNVFASGNNGLCGTATNAGDPTFSGHFTNHTYSYNVRYADPGGTYTGTGNQVATAATDVFTDFANRDYTVKAAYQNDGSDGTDPGADITALNAAILHAEDGQWGSEPATYSDSSYTNAELPRTYIDTTYAAQTGTTHNCSTSAQFTTALANCAVGDTIVLTAGNTFQHATTAFTLRDI